MDRLFSNFKIEVPDGIFLKDPMSSTLGKRIVGQGVVLMQEIGFEQFNFKKLGQIIGSNESSIYRYFESKHHLLIYFTCWYWVWIEYQVVIETFALKESREKLLQCIEVVARQVKEDSNFSHINEVLLHQIIVLENSKSYLTAAVDTENKEGFFKPYKQLVRRLAEMIQAVNPKYSFSLSLANAVLEGALQQHFFQQHFKSITNCNQSSSVSDFYKDLVIKTITHE